jgi:hypothetical protein
VGGVVGEYILHLFFLLRWHCPEAVMITCNFCALRDMAEMAQVLEHAHQDEGIHKGCANQYLEMQSGKPRAKVSHEAAHKHRCSNQHRK